MLSVLQILWSIILCSAGLWASYHVFRWLVARVREGAFTHGVPVPRNDVWRILVIAVIFWPRAVLRLLWFFRGKSRVIVERERQIGIEEDYELDHARLRRMQHEQKLRKK